ncbi:nitrilase-related carbon-nitrogen hydrolase [Arsenophonus endosymbiont of Bemisia tabaci]|uniref:nitrilase-related carbon-nitrogen hydrolase n=1 Tax=Arsenophonus endosymbiont of Bemisia tabaci TaxID=536059 RepID=UPI0017584ECF|nr:nitrilase-related carbon-nitrogen hydrolase [Arsenophonus endosymbiont of Bemisia tabaci]CAA2930859.1 Nitrilase [Arsenophonus endosymbiont of Bemisia tabaci Q2]
MSPEVNIALSRSYAVEGQCFVIAPCAIVSEQIIEQLCTDKTKRNLLKAGGDHACIFGPDGSQLTTPFSENEEGLLLATLDPASITFAKAIADPVGHYSRPDVTSLLFNPAANQSPVID